MDSSFLFVFYPKSAPNRGRMQNRKATAPLNAGDGNSWFKGLKLQRAAIAAGQAATTAEALCMAVHGIKV
jgi:hypothetical protein